MRDTRKQDYLSDNLNHFLFGALAFSVSSAWNSAFQNYFKESPYLKDRRPWLYAVFISGFAIVCAWLLYEATNKMRNVEIMIRGTSESESENEETYGKKVKLVESKNKFYKQSAGLNKRYGSNKRRVSN